MFLKLKLISFNIASSILLITFLCLGSQNLDKRYKLNILISETVKIPIGFLVGVSFTLGALSGGLTSTLIMSNRDSEQNL